MCALFVLAFAVIAQTKRRTNMEKIQGLCSADALDCPANGPLMFACLRMKLFPFAPERSPDRGRKFNHCRQRRRRSCTQ
jgi:hypothetical protein